MTQQRNFENCSSYAVQCRRCKYKENLEALLLPGEGWYAEDSILYCHRTETCVVSYGDCPEFEDS